MTTDNEQIFFFLVRRVGREKRARRSMFARERERARGHFLAFISHLTRRLTKKRTATSLGWPML